MDDSLMNPMKTGLMFVPLGPAVSAGYPTHARRREHVVDLETGTENAAPAPAFALWAWCRAMRRRFLKRIRPVPQPHVASVG